MMDDFVDLNREIFTSSLGRLFAKDVTLCLETPKFPELVSIRDG